MGFFSNIFGNKQKKLVSEPNNTHKLKQSNIQIKYKSELIDNLKNDHQKLFQIYGQLINLTNKNDYKGIPGKLGELKLALQGHVLVENVQFYVYVQERHKDDPINTEFIKDVRRDMNNIARAVVDFVKKYQIKVFTNEVKVSFIKELNAIGDALTKRVEMEESQLYTLYIQ